MQLTRKTIPMIFLIFVPSYIGICYYIYGYMVYSALSTGHEFNLHSNYFLYPVLKSAQGCYVIIIAYGLSPIIRSTKYTKNTGYEKIVSEFEFIKKISFIAMPILIISLTLILLFPQVISYNYLSYALGVAIFASSAAVAIGTIVRISSRVAKKEFRFYLARGYCILASRSDGDLDKMQYISLSLDSYNKYLLRKMNLGVKNINKINSLLVYSDPKKKDEIINSICECFSSDKLKLATYLAALYEVPHTEDFFIKQAFIEKLKGIGAFLVAAIPIVISIVQLFHLI